MVGRRRHRCWNMLLLLGLSDLSFKGSNVVEAVEKAQADVRRKNQSAELVIQDASQSDLEAVMVPARRSKGKMIEKYNSIKAEHPSATLCNQGG